MSKTGYILYERNGSYHKKLIGLFENESQAKLYARALKQKPHETIRGEKFIVEELNFLDDDPLLVQYVMESTNGEEKAC